MFLLKAKVLSYKTLNPNFTKSSAQAICCRIGNSTQKARHEQVGVVPALGYTCICNRSILATQLTRRNADTH